MPIRPSALRILACSALALGLGAAATFTVAPGAQVSLDLTTLHAAALSASRGAADSMDAPYILVSVVGSSGQSETRELPATGHYAIHLDQALGQAPITRLELQPGDSVRVLLSVLENSDAATNELPVATAATRTLTEQRPRFAIPAATIVTPALAPLTGAGAHWLGSASLLISNVGGKLLWGSLDCVQSCKVLKTPAQAGTPGAELDAAGASGVVELSGASATYHMQVAAKRVM